MNLRLTSKYQVVTRYTLSIFGVFIAIMLVSLFWASYRYYEELELFEVTEQQRLTSQTQAIDNAILQTVDSLKSIQSYASYSLSFNPEKSSQLPDFAQDEEQYYLKSVKRDILEQRQNLSVNITGEGLFNQLPADALAELRMAYALTPAFISAQSTNELANWFYYVSLNKFVGIYPWISKKHWRYSSSLIDNEQIAQLKQTSYFNSNVVWSNPYLGASANSLYTSVAGGVFKKDKFVGAVVINVDLARLHRALSLDGNDDNAYVLFNQHDNLLLHKHGENDAVASLLQWQQVIPEALHGLSSAHLRQQPVSFKFGKYLVQQQKIPATGWTLIKYQPYDEFVDPIFARFVWFFSLLAVGQLALLTLIYVVTRKTFIKPTEAFISHIAYSAQGDHGKVKAPDGWRQWFDIVGDIFSQNRSLLQQLKDQNNILDMRVNEKTQALQEKSRQHQHDYAILRSVMNAIPDYLIFNDTRGHVIGCNLAFERFIDLAETHILGQKAGNLIDNELGQALIKAISEDEHKESLHGIFKVIETMENTYELFTSAFYNEQNLPLGSIVIIRDVTSQYAVNAALEKAKEQAELANQAKSQFLANMSHEIRTPINAIQGMHSLLQNTQLTNQQKQNITHAQDASDALLHLVDELLDLAKIESGNMKMVNEVCSLDQIINRAIKLNLDAIVEKQLELIVEIAADIPAMVVTDDMRLVQVVSNLLNNAVKFTHRGRISIVLSVIAGGDEDVLVRFSVKDTGIGIAKDKQAKLFEAFMQADETMTREYGGSGLGLSICQRIVNLLGGEIKLSSEANKGAEFSFVLPFSNNTKTDIDYHSSRQVISIGKTLPTTFLTLLDDLNYQFQQLEMAQQLQGLSTDGQTFIFVELTLLDNENCLEIAQFICNKGNDKYHDCIVAVVQSTYQEQDNLKYALLDQHNIPYLVCEQPLYRFCLYQLISMSLVTNRKIANEVANTKLSTPAPEPKRKQQNLAGISVLLVEDNLVNQLVAKELLKSMGASVEVAENGQLAIEYLSDNTVDVVLMDIQMPVMDGLTATRYIREKLALKALPIIAMTAHAREEDRESSMAAGMNLHVAKPVKGDILLASVLSVLPNVTVS